MTGAGLGERVRGEDGEAPHDRDRWQGEVEAMAAKGYRVLAVAEKPMPPSHTELKFADIDLFNARYINAPVLNREGLFGNRYVLMAVALLLLFQFAFTYLGPCRPSSRPPPSVRRNGCALSWWPRPCSSW